MSSLESIFNKHEALRGELVTPEGWDTLLEITECRRPIAVIDNFLTKRAGRHLTHENPDAIDSTAEQIGSWLIELSGLTTTKDHWGVLDVLHKPGSMPLHVDVNISDVYLYNFKVSGKPSYEAYPYVSDGFSTFTTDEGRDYLVSVTSEKRVYPISDNQLTILQGDAVCARFPTLTPLDNTRSTIPHEVIVPAGASRNLLAAYL